MAIDVREAVESDAHAIAAAQVRAWQVAYQGIVAQDVLDAMSIDDRTERWAAIIRGEMPVPGVPAPANLVAELDGRVLAFASVGRFRDEPGNETAGELWAMYAHPDAWGAGLGHALMDQSFHRLRAHGIADAYLWVFTKNDRGRAFYSRQGWHKDDATNSMTLQGASIESTRYSIGL